MNLIFKGYIPKSSCEVMCAATGIVIGTVLKSVSGKFRYFQDNIDYPLDSKLLREIAEYLDKLNSKEMQ